MIRKKDYTNLSDEDLMDLVKRSDSEAFSAIYDRYSKLTLNFFFKMLWKDREKAEDFMQDLFMKIVNRPELYNSSRPFKTWLFSVANNMCKNEYRKAEVRVNAAPEIFSSAITKSANKGDKKLDNDAFISELDEALKEMDQVKRSTFIMRFKQGLSIKEISEVHECSEGTVKSRIFYTVKSLNEKLIHFKYIASLTLILNSLIQ